MKTREAVVEGRFYPDTESKIFNQIREIEQRDRFPFEKFSTDRIFGAVLPHAGHLYSGYQTIPFFKVLRHLGEYPETFIIVHPNHSGLGKALAVDDADIWTNSIGDIPIDREFANALELPFDSLAHAREHSAEVILPFLQYFLPDMPFSIVPICMLDQGYRSASIVAKRIRQAEKVTGRRIMVIASCDFSHFSTPEEGKIKDQLVIDKIVARKPTSIEKVVKQNHISVCGYGPIMSLMEYAGAMEANYQIKILARGHSGEVHPSREVVDYISIIMYQ